MKKWKKTQVATYHKLAKSMKRKKEGDDSLESKEA
jgi:hypothetical protein